MMRTLVVRPLADERDAAAWATREELAAAAAFPSELRRREYLGWRALVRERLGRDAAIAYDDAGAPVVIDREGVHLSVSHAAGWVALLLADAPCGVDIESADRDFSCVARRCMTDDERRLSDSPLWPGVAWCAKEALYKLAGRSGLDLRRDVRLERADLAIDPAAGATADPADFAADFATDFAAGAAGSVVPAVGGLVGRIAGGEPVRLAVRCDGRLIVVHTL